MTAAYLIGVCIKYTASIAIRQPPFFLGETDLPLLWETTQTDASGSDGEFADPEDGPIASYSSRGTCMVSSGSSLEERMKPVTTAASGVSTSTEGTAPPVSTSNEGTAPRAFVAEEEED